MAKYLFFPIVLVLFLLPEISFAQLPSDEIVKKYSIEQLQEDFNILRNCLEQHSPALDAYTEKSQLNENFDAIYQGIDQEMTGIEFYRHIAPMLLLIRNGHTEIEIPASYKQATQTSLPRLPFVFYYDQGKLYIRKNGSEDESILPKTIVKSINGESAIDLLQTFSNTVTRDGYNESLPLLTASSLFSYYYARIKGCPEQYELDLLSPNGEERKVIVIGLALPALSAKLLKRYGPSPKSFWADQSQPAISLSIEEQIATLTIKTFDKKTAKKRGQPFKRFLNECFAKINAAGAQHLILDLRNNGGGDPMPTVELFSHLHDQPFTFYKEVSATTKKFKNEHYDYPMWTLNLVAKILLKKQGNRYVVKRMDGTKEAKPAKEIFRGQLYVLTDPNSFSATGEMSAIIKEHTDALFIGEELGGNPIQNTSGVMLPLLLPHSKVIAVIPTILWEMNVTFENTGHGVMPDHEVRATIDDKISKRDAVMEYTHALIKGQN